MKTFIIGNNHFCTSPLENNYLKIISWTRDIHNNQQLLLQYENSGGACLEYIRHGNGVMASDTKIDRHKVGSHGEDKDIN